MELYSFPAWLDAVDPEVDRTEALFAATIGSVGVFVVGFVIRGSIVLVSSETVATEGASVTSTVGAVVGAVLGIRASAKISAGSLHLPVALQQQGFRLLGN